MHAATQQISSERLPQIRMPRPERIKAMIVRRCKEVARSELPPRRHRKCGDIGSLPMWTHRSQCDTPFAKRLLANEAKFPAYTPEALLNAPRWLWRTGRDARNYEAERIAKRYRVTHAQLFLIDELLHEVYGVGETPFKARPLSGQLVGLVEQIGPRSHIDNEFFISGFGRRINEEVCEVLKAACSGFPPLCVLLDQQITALVMTLYTTEIFKCASRKTFLN